MKSLLSIGFAVALLAGVPANAQTVIPKPPETLAKGFCNISGGKVTGSASNPGPRAAECRINCEIVLMSNDTEHLGCNKWAKVPGNTANMHICNVFGNAKSVNANLSVCRNLKKPKKLKKSRG